MLWGYRQDWSSPERLRPSITLHFSGKWIISTIVFIADVVHQALPTITCSYEAIVYLCGTTINSVYGFEMQSPTRIPKMVVWPWAKVRFTCPTNVREVSSKFPSCLMVVLTINFGVHISICSDWNCGSYSLDRLLWHMTNGNERWIIDGWNPPDICCPHRDSHSPLCVSLENRPVKGPARVWSRRWSTTYLRYNKYSSRCDECMKRSISSSWSGFLFFLARGSTLRDRQYPQHDSPNDPLKWYGPSDGTTLRWLGPHWWRLPCLRPGGADRAARQFF